MNIKFSVFLKVSLCIVSNSYNTDEILLFFLFIYSNKKLNIIEQEHRISVYIFLCFRILKNSERLYALQFI